MSHKLCGLMITSQDTCSLPSVKLNTADQILIVTFILSLCSKNTSFKHRPKPEKYPEWPRLTGVYRWSSSVVSVVWKICLKFSEHSFLLMVIEKDYQKKFWPFLKNFRKRQNFERFLKIYFHTKIPNRTTPRKSIKVLRSNSGSISVRARLDVVMKMSSNFNCSAVCSIFIGNLCVLECY